MTLDPDTLLEDRATHTLTRLAEFRSGQSAVAAELAVRLRNHNLVTARDLVLGGALDRSLCDLGLRRGDDTRFEATGVAVTAGTGSGKSHAFRRVLSMHPLFPGFGKPGSGCPAIGVRCKGSFTLGRLGAGLATAAGYPIRSNEENVIWSRLRPLLRQRGVALVYIDELNSLLRNANGKERGKIVDTLKGLMNDEEWPVVVALSGTPRIREIIEAHDPDKELSRRLRWIEFPRLRYPRDSRMLATHVGDLCGMAQLTLDDATFRSEIAPRLIHAARHQLGSTISFSITAIEIAVEKGDGELGVEHFATAFARMSAKSAAENPFIASDWASVKVYDADEEEFKGPVWRNRGATA